MTQSVDECPDCGARMVERTNRKTGEMFLGCSTYPECSGTGEIQSGIEDDGPPSVRRSRNDSRRWEKE